MVIFKFIKLILENKPITIYGDGKSSRDYTYVTDVSDALIASTKLNGYEIFNVGGGSATTLDNLENYRIIVGKESYYSKYLKRPF